MRIVLAVALAVGCAGRAEPEPPDPPRSTSEAAGDHAADPPVEPIVAVPDEPPADPPPPVTITEEVSRYGVVAVSIANRSEGPANVALRLVLEREVEGTFVGADDLGTFDVPGVGEGSCAELLSGTELRESWGCLRGEERGAHGHGCTAAAGGRYRFVATSCDGRSRTESEPFAYP